MMLWQNSKNKEKKCTTCGRVITDPKNKSGLCQRCEKRAAAGAGAVGFAVLGFLTKKMAKPATKVVKQIIK